ncbi:MAG TPA: hypothetical protein GX497_01860, partial [Bacillus bacterium]|nr:hypothetical protein [Bacillus sp. (in: firmicutes)]
TPNGGQSGNNGQLLNGNGSEGNSGQVPIGGQVGNGNQIVNGNGQAGKNSQLPNGIQIPTDKWFAEYIPAEGNGRLEENGSSKIPKAQFGEETTTSLGKILFQTRDDSRGIFGHVKGVIVDAQNYLFSFLNKDVAGPVLAKIAGFDAKPMPNGKSGYAVTIEKNKYSNKLLNNIYQDYKRYYDGETKSLGVQTKQIREKTFNTYFNSKNFRPKGMNPVKYWAKSMITAVNDAWNPFTKKIFTKKGLMDGTAFNKGFWSGSNIAKLGGPLNVILSSANSLFDYSKVGKHRDYGYKSTEFAADLSVELAIGVGTTALGSVATSMAIGAAAGSVVPVAGTIAGAVAGLLVGLGSNYLINGTRRGIRIKNRVKKAVNAAFEIGVNAFYKGVEKLGGVFGF